MNLGCEKRERNTEFLWGNVLESNYLIDRDNIVSIVVKKFMFISCEDKNLIEMDELRGFSLVFTSVYNTSESVDQSVT
jgi:hypothetical protein